MLSVLRLSAVLGSLCLVLAGCGRGHTSPKGVIVTGTILQDGKALDVPNREAGLGNVLISLVPLGQSQPRPMVEHAMAAKDGTFKVVGPGQGVPPGKYRLSVQQQDRGPGSDMLKGAFSEKASPIEIDVPADKVGGTHSLGEIDLAKLKK